MCGDDDSDDYDDEDVDRASERRERKRATINSSSNKCSLCVVYCVCIQYECIFASGVSGFQYSCLDYLMYFRFLFRYSKFILGDVRKQASVCVACVWFFLSPIFGLRSVFCSLFIFIIILHSLSFASVKKMCALNRLPEQFISYAHENKHPYESWPMRFPSLKIA